MKTCLFIIIPTKNGGNWFEGAVRKCKNVVDFCDNGKWRQGGEGGNFNGGGKFFLRPKNHNCDYLCTEIKKQFREKFDPEKFKKGQEGQWKKDTKKAKLENKDAVFVSKTPELIMAADLVYPVFPNCKMVFSVRNPYPVIESICFRTNWKDKPDTLDRAIKHCIETLKLQKANIENKRFNSIWFTYEEMCENPETVEQKIIEFIPELHDFTIVKHKQRCHNIEKKKQPQGLKNYNELQISKLTPLMIGEINKSFKQHKELLEYFGYKLL
jgi:hypothetical protein